MSTSRDDTQSVHTSRTPHSNAIDLTDDQEDSSEVTINRHVSASTSSRASGQPQRPAPAPTASGSVRVTSSVNIAASFKRRKNERAWAEPQAQASSNMAHRSKGTAFKPEDPERKHRHMDVAKHPSRNASGNPYVQHVNMPVGTSKRERTIAVREGKKNKSLPVPGNTDRLMQQATKPKVPYANSLSGMAPIPKKRNVSDHSRRSSTEDDDSHAPQASTSRLADDRPHEFSIKGAAGGPPRPATSAASNGKGKGKAPEVLDLADSDADVDPIEDDSPPPNMSSSHRHRDAQRVYEAAPTGGHSSPDPLTLEGKPPFNLTSRPQSGQFPAFENRNTSKYEALSMHGKVQSGVEQFGGGVGGKTKVVAKMQGKRSTAPVTAEERRRRADGAGNPENEFDSPPAPATKSNKSKTPRTSNTVPSIVALPVQLYMIAMEAVPIRLQHQDFFLAYNPGGHLDNQTVSICKGNPGNQLHTFRRSTCDSVVLSDLNVNSERPVIEFQLKQSSGVFVNMLKECDLTERAAAEKPSLVVIFETHGLGDGTEIEKLFDMFRTWTQEPGRIHVGQSSASGDHAILDKYGDVFARCVEKADSTRTSSRTATTNGVASGSGSAGSTTVTQRRIPQKALEKNIKQMQQTTLASHVATTSTAEPRRSGRASTSAFASSQPRRAPTPEIDRVPPDKVVLVYPIGEPTGVVSITHGDTKRLQDGEFLNDTLIEFGLKHIHRQLRDSEEARGVADDAKRLSSRVHMFNSFFYKKLTQKTGKKTGGKDNMKIDAHATVKKWTSKIDIFEQDFVVVPINEHLHWYLAVIVNPGAALRWATSKEAIEAAKEPKAPSRKSVRQEEKQQGASSPGSRVASNEPPPSLSEPLTTSHFFPKPAKSAPTPMDVDDDDTAQEELEKQEEARIASQISAAAAQTEMGAEDGDFAVRQEEGGDSDVVMEDVATRANSPMSHRSAQAGVESSSEDDEALVAGQLRHPSAAQPFQGQDRVRPPTPPHPSAAHASPLKRVPTPIEPSKFAPGDKAPPPVVQQAQDYITVDDEDEQPARAAGLSLTHKTDICYVYTFDSLGTRHVSVIRNLLSYLAAEALDKKKVYIDVNKFTLHGSMGAMVKVPQQDNFSDCGLYVLHYVEKLLERPDHMLQHIASIPDKPPKDKAAEVDQLVQAEWDGPAAAGKRKTLREEVAKLCEQWAKYREPLEKEEAKEREEKARKKKAKREEQEAMAIAQAAELAESRSRAASGSITIEDDDRGDTSSMIVGDDAAAVAAPAQPAVEDDYVDSPAPSAGSGRSPGKKGRKGGAKGRGKKGPKAAKKPKEVEVLELSSDDDDGSDNDLPAPQPRAAAAAPVASTSTSASTSNGHKKPRGSEASTFVPTVAYTTTTSPKQTPPPEASAARSHGPPPSRLPPPDLNHNSGPSFSNGRGSVDIDVHYENGDLETPEPESQVQQPLKRTTRNHDHAVSPREENSPPPKKRLRRGAETKKEAAPSHAQAEAEAGSAHSSRTRGEPYPDTPGISAAIPLAEEILSRQHGEGQQGPAPQQPAMSTASYPRLPSVDPALEIALEIRGKSKGKGKDKGKGLQRADSDQRIFFDEAHGPQYDGQHDDSGDILVLSSPNQSSSRKPPEPSPELCAPPQTHQQHQALYDPTSPQARSPRPRQTARNPRASGSSADFFPPEQSHSPLRQRPLVQAQQQQQHQYVAPGASSPVRIVEHVEVPVGVGAGRRGGGRGREGVEATEVVTIDDDDE